MKNSYRFFANKDCKYYPCHPEIEGDMNCLFCYCPLYMLPDCGGDFTMTAGGIKDCSPCLKIHEADSWSFVNKRLMEEVHKTLEKNQKKETEE